MVADAPCEPVSAPANAAAPPPLLSQLARRPYTLLALLCLLLWLPGILSLPALDRDESRFAESSRQMLDSGDFIDIRFAQVPRYKKPVGIYWAQAAATAAAGPLTGNPGDHSHIWTYRLPSLLGGIAAVWLTIWCASALAGAEAAFLAGLLMATSILLTAEATIATTDAFLLATVLGAQGVLLRVYRSAMDPAAPSPSTRLVMAGWVSLAAGMLVKFPVAPGVAVATIVALVIWDRQWQWLATLKPVRGLLLCAALVLPWLIAITLKSHGAFFQQSLGDDFAAKVAGGQESHGAWSGYFLVTAMVSFWPAILFILPGVGLALTRRTEPGIRFLIAWAGAWWLLVEAVPTKLPHYVLPAYPALAIMAALWLLLPGEGGTGWRRWLRWAGAFQFAIGLLALAAAPVVLPHLYGSGEVWWQMAGTAAVSLAGLVALALFLTGRKLAALMPAMIAVVIVVPLLTAGVAPGLTRLWMSHALAARVAKDRNANDPPPVLAGYTEPSLVFALGADVGLTDGRGAAEWGANKGGLALVEDGERPQFLAHLAERQANAAAIDQVSGLNYSRGRPTHVTVYRVTRAHDLPSLQRP